MSMWNVNLGRLTRGALIVAALVCGTDLAAGQETGRTVVPGTLEVLEPTRDAKVAVSDARKRVRVKDPTYGTGLSTAQSLVLTALDASEVAQWPESMRSRRRKIERDLSEAEALLAGTMNRSKRAGWGYVERDTAGAKKRLARAQRLLEPIAPVPLVNEDPDPVDPVDPPVPTSSFAWTELTPSSDSRVIYVSSSQGNDSNNGLSTTAPVRTLSKGYSLLRDGYPDWLLLRRGDTWVIGTGDALGSTASGGDWDRSGRSATEKMVVSTYGTGARPYIKASGTTTVIHAYGNDNGRFAHVAFIGLNCKAFTRDPTDPGYVGQAGDAAIDIGYCEDILFEDCRFSFFNYGAKVSPYGDSNVRKNLSFRRCVISDSYGVNGNHNQGIYSWATDGLLLEECFFVRNGWHPTLFPANIFNRNLYIAGSGNTTMRGCVDGDGASGGAQLRMGGLAEDNLFVQNPSGISIGHPQNPAGSYATGIFRRNVILGARNIDNQPRGAGVELGNRVRGFEMYENIIAHNERGTGNEMGISTNWAVYHAGQNEACSNITIRDNIVYDWSRGSQWSASLLFGTNPDGFTNVSVRNNVFVETATGAKIVDTAVRWTGITFANNAYYTPRNASQWFTVNGTDYNFDGWRNTMTDTGSTTTAPTYTDPNRTIETYMTSIGQTATVDAFLTRCREQSRDNWRTEYAARTVIDYVRAGFDLPALPK